MDDELGAHHQGATTMKRRGPGKITTGEQPPRGPYIESWYYLCTHCPLIACAEENPNCATPCPIEAARAAGLNARLTVALLKQVDSDLWRYEQATTELQSQLCGPTRRPYTKRAPKGNQQPEPPIPPEVRGHFNGTPFTIRQFQQQAGLTISRARSAIGSAVDSEELILSGYNRRGGRLFVFKHKDAREEKKEPTP